MDFLFFFALREGCQKRKSQLPGPRNRHGSGPTPTPLPSTQQTNLSERSKPQPQNLPCIRVPVRSGQGQDRSGCLYSSHTTFTFTTHHVYHSLCSPTTIFIDKLLHHSPCSPPSMVITLTMFVLHDTNNVVLSTTFSYHNPEHQNFIYLIAMRSSWSAVSSTMYHWVATPWSERGSPFSCRCRYTLLYHLTNVGCAAAFCSVHDGAMQAPRETDRTVPRRQMRRKQPAIVPLFLSSMGDPTLASLVQTTPWRATSTEWKSIPMRTYPAASNMNIKAVR